jgi:hypothetical protein
MSSPAYSTSEPRAPRPGVEVRERAHGDARRRSAFLVYGGRGTVFWRPDWLGYVAWVGLMLGLVFATGGFVAVGHFHGVALPAEAYWVPLGAAVFTLSIAIDTVGHRTIYKAEIQRAEGLVHGITIFCGIGSCLLLCLAYQARAGLWIPAMVLTLLSFLYSLIDEAFHWRRYVSQQSDPVEMWSHVGIFVGHSVMMVACWAWFFHGYAGVAQTLVFLSPYG